MNIKLYGISVNINPNNGDKKISFLKREMLKKSYLSEIRCPFFLLQSNAFNGIKKFTDYHNHISINDKPDSSKAFHWFHIKRSILCHFSIEMPGLIPLLFLQYEFDILSLGKRSCLLLLSYQIMYWDCLNHMMWVIGKWFLLKAWSYSSTASQTK